MQLLNSNENDQILSRHDQGAAPVLCYCPSKAFAKNNDFPLLCIRRPDQPVTAMITLSFIAHSHMFVFDLLYVDLS